MNDNVEGISETQKKKHEEMKAKAAKEEALKTKIEDFCLMLKTEFDCKALVLVDIHDRHAIVKNDDTINYLETRGLFSACQDVFS